MSIVYNGQEISFKGWVKPTFEYLAAKFCRKKYKEVSVDELNHMLDSHDDILVIDCRFERVYSNFGHIPKSVNYPITTFMEDCWEIPHDKQIVVVCYFGMYCQAAAQKLAEIGHKDVLIMTGGMDKWNSADKPVQKGQQ